MFTDGRQKYLGIASHCVVGDDCRLAGNMLVQPSIIDGGGKDDVIGEVYQCSDLTQLELTTDFCLITPKVDVDPNILGLDLKPTGKYADVKPGMQVVMSGRTSGVREGTIMATNVMVKIEYQCGYKVFKNGILATALSLEGDSGAPVIAKDTGDYVGYIVGGSSTMSLIGYGKLLEKEFKVKPVA